MKAARKELHALIQQKIRVLLGEKARTGTLKCLGKSTTGTAIPEKQARRHTPTASAEMCEPVPVVTV